MKHKVLAVFLALATTFVASAAPRPAPPPPVITADCDGGACTAGDHITFYGSGFKQGGSVYLTVKGNGVNQAITVTIDNLGNFSTDFGGALLYAAGTYTVDAYTVKGRRATLVYTISFNVS